MVDGFWFWSLTWIWFCWSFIRDGIANDQLFLSLLFFNIGIEIGQLMIIPVVGIIIFFLIKLILKTISKSRNLWNWWYGLFLVYDKNLGYCGLMSPTFNAPLVLLMQNFLQFLSHFLGICIYLYRAKSKYLLALLPLLALSTHQFEEYVLSPLLFGDYYHFLNWAYRNGMDISPMEVTLLNLTPYLILLPALVI